MYRKIKEKKRNRGEGDRSKGVKPSTGIARGQIYKTTKGHWCWGRFWGSEGRRVVIIWVCSWIVFWDNDFFDSSFLVFLFSHICQLRIDSLVHLCVFSYLPRSFYSPSTHICIPSTTSVSPLPEDLHLLIYICIKVRSFMPT